MTESKMCYHATFLFSLCGHISISSSPVRNTPKCSKSNTQNVQSQRLNHSTGDLTQSNGTRGGSQKQIDVVSSPTTSKIVTSRLSYQSITSPFPSPQEFEFVQQAHDISVPATPISPNVVKSLHKTRSRPMTGDSTDIIAAYAGASPAASLSNEDDHSLQTAPQCDKIVRHPLHTYILPHLCPPCRLQREQNVARFELQAMKEAIDRDRSGHWTGARPTDIIDNHRKRIHRRSAGKGKLIPLICVEENRIGKAVLQKQAMEEALRRQTQSTFSVAVEEEPEYLPLTQDSTTESGDVTGSMTVNLVAKDRISSTRNSAATTAAVKTPSSTTSKWGRSWWSKGIEGVLDSSGPSQAANTTRQKPVDQYPKTLDVYNPLAVSADGLAIENTRQAQGEDASTANKGSTNVDWSETQHIWKGINGEVKRDLFGRNAGAMSKIMSFSPASVDTNIKRM